MSSPDSWQDNAFSTRHMHNRNSNSTSAPKSTKPFDVRKTFGSYSLKCPAWQKLPSSQAHQQAPLELYRLTQNGQGIVGEITLPGALRASVVLAASRKSLARCVEELEGESDNGEEEGEGNDYNDDDEHGKEDEEESDENKDDEDDEEREDEEQTRFSTFSKNSFRNPKFWLHWNGTPSLSVPERPDRDAQNPATETRDTGLGYVVFSNNECRKFKGTLNCRALGWKDVAISGWKDVGRGERGVDVRWGKR